MAGPSSRNGLPSFAKPSNASFASLKGSENISLLLYTSIDVGVPLGFAFSIKGSKGIAYLPFISRCFLCLISFPFECKRGGAEPSSISLSH